MGQNEHLSPQGRVHESHLIVRHLTPCGDIPSFEMSSLSALVSPGTPHQRPKPMTITGRVSEWDLLISRRVHLNLAIFLSGPVAKKRKMIFSGSLSTDSINWHKPLLGWSWQMMKRQE